MKRRSAPQIPEKSTLPSAVRGAGPLRRRLRGALNGFALTAELSGRQAPHDRSNAQGARHGHTLEGLEYYRIIAMQACQVRTFRRHTPMDAELTGRRLGVYQLHERIGAGGMGEVYRARDTQLQRDVAMKILPHTFTAEPDRRARFEREARTLASLNHPNIATIHGVEDGRRHPRPGDGAGRRRDDRGSTPARDPASSRSAAVARQIADALDTAHERGIVHRDLKPANVKVTSSGLVKVLDFGLGQGRRRR